MSFKKYFLPLGLITAITIALILPNPGTVFKSWGAIPLLIMIIFVTNGFQATLNLKDINARLGVSFVVMSILNLCLAPFLGMWAAHFLGLSADFALGLMVITAMPTTLSSGIVISNIAGGSGIWALMYTMGLNLVGIFTIPLLLPLTLGGGDIDIRAEMLLYKLLTMVLLPFVIGIALKYGVRFMNSLVASGTTSSATRATPSRYRIYISLIPSICVILVVWCSLSSSRDILLNMPLSMLLFALAGALAVHTTLLFLHYLCATPLRLNEDEKRSFVIVGSQKTLPIAISVLSSLHIEIAQALLVCLIFHFSQLILDSFIASKWEYNVEIEPH